MRSGPWLALSMAEISQMLEIISIQLPFPIPLISQLIDEFGWVLQSRAINHKSAMSHSLAAPHSRSREILIGPGEISTRLSKLNHASSYYIRQACSRDARLMTERSPQISHIKKRKFYNPQMVPIIWSNLKQCNGIRLRAQKGCKTGIQGSGIGDDHHLWWGIRGALPAFYRSKDILCMLCAYGVMRLLQGRDIIACCHWLNNVSFLCDI